MPLGAALAILIYLHHHFAFAINCPLCAVSVTAMLRAGLAAPSRFRYLPSALCWQETCPAS